MQNGAFSVWSTPKSTFKKYYFSNLVLWSWPVDMLDICWILIANLWISHIRWYEKENIQQTKEFKKFIVMVICVSWALNGFRPKLCVPRIVEKPGYDGQSSWSREKKRKRWLLRKPCMARLKGVFFRFLKRVWWPTNGRLLDRPSVRLARRGNIVVLSC